MNCRALGVVRFPTVVNITPSVDYNTHAEDVTIGLSFVVQSFVFKSINYLCGCVSPNDVVAAIMVARSVTAVAFDIFPGSYYYRIAISGYQQIS